MAKVKSLQDICVKAIAVSFDIFYNAYCTTTNQHQHRGILLLQKLYSFELVSHLSDEDLLEERYAEFVFNKNLKFINTLWFKKISWEKIVETFKRIGSSVERANFHKDYRPRVLWKNIICHLPNLRDVAYTDHCNNSVLKCIAKHCPRLERLDIGWSICVTDVGLGYFCKRVKGTKRKRMRKGKKENCTDCEDEGNVPCPLLREICEDGTSVGKGVIQRLLESLPLLEEVSYHNLPVLLYEMHRESLGSLNCVKWYNIVSLDLRFYNEGTYAQLYDDILKVCVTVCPNLKGLCCPVLKLDHVDLCSTLCHVEDLLLECVCSPRPEINDFLKLRGGKLNNLSLENCTLSLSVLGQYCFYLQVLTLDNVVFQHNEFRYVPTFYNLKSINFQFFDLSDSGNWKALLLFLTSSPILEDLYLGNCTPFTSRMQSEVVKCCQQLALKHIDFDGTVDVKFFKDILLTCCTLKTIHISSDAPIDIKDLKRTAKMLPNRPKIKYFRSGLV